MKFNSQLNGMVGASLLILHIACCSSLCLGAEDDAKPDFDKQLSQLEDVWKAGKTNEFCTQVKKMSKRMVARQPDKDSINASAKFLEYLCAKEFAVKGSGIGILFQTKELATFVAYLDKDQSPERRQKNTALLAQYLGHIRGERIPDFHPLPATTNVKPPDGVPGFSGMNPDAIDDPIAKAKYLKAIQQNDENILTNSRQILLDRIEKSVSRPILEYMVATIKHGDVPAALVAEWINSANLNDKEREEVKAKSDSE